jgi:acyl carrier protein
MTVLALQQARETIARLIEEHMGIDAVRVLEDIPFAELHKDFDSLTMLELQLLLEKEYGVEFDLESGPGQHSVPKNATELAEAILSQCAQHREREARKASLRGEKTEPPSLPVRDA